MHFSLAVIQLIKNSFYHKGNLEQLIILISLAVAMIINKILPKVGHSPGMLKVYKSPVKYPG
jgi:hypothetical protein